MAVAAILAVLDWAAVAARSKVLERCAKPGVLLALLVAAAIAHPGHAGVHGWLLLALGFGLIGDVALSFAAPGQLAPPPEARPRPPAAAAAEVGGIELLEAAGIELAQPEAVARPAAGAHRADRSRQAARLAETAETAEAAEPAEAAEAAGPAGPDPAQTATAGGPQPPDIAFSAGLASFLIGHICYCAAMLRYGTDQLSLGFGLVLVLLALLAFGQRVLSGAQAQAGTGLTVAVAAYITALGSAVVLGIGTSSLWVAYGIVLFAFSDLVLASDRFVRPLRRAPLIVAVSYHLAQALLVLGLVH